MCLPHTSLSLGIVTPFDTTLLLESASFFRFTSAPHFNHVPSLYAACPSPTTEHLQWAYACKEPSCCGMVQPMTGACDQSLNLNGCACLGDYPRSRVEGGALPAQLIVYNAVIATELTGRISSSSMDWISYYACGWWVKVWNSLPEISFSSEA